MRKLFQWIICWKYNVEDKGPYQEMCEVCKDKKTRKVGSMKTKVLGHCRRFEGFYFISVFSRGFSGGDTSYF